jgi:hypothetical protein
LSRNRRLVLLKASAPLLEPGAEAINLTQRGATAGTGENGVGGNLVAAGRTIEPVATEPALLLGKPLLFLALRAAAIHFTVFQIIFKKQPTSRALAGTGLMNDRFTPGDRTFKNNFTFAAPVLTF